MSDFKPQLGRLPPIPGRPALMLTALALPTPPPSVDYLELVPSPGMLGNDEWGDCVFAAIEHNRLVTAAAVGATITPLTAQQVVSNYCACTGATKRPGPGAVEQLAFEWAQKYGWGASRLLCFAKVDTSLTPIRDTVAEFYSCVFGVEIDQSQEYPATIWNADNSPEEGGHGVNGGSYETAPDYTDVFTWGYRAKMTDSYLAAKVGETWVLVWDFMWSGLSYDRQVQLASDYEALTGKPFPVTPVTPYTPRSAMTFTPIAPFRAFDSRKAGGKLSPNMPKAVQVTGAAAPAGTVAIAGNLTIVGPDRAGWAVIQPMPTPVVTSAVNFTAGQTVANGFVIGLSVDGVVYVSSIANADFLVDITGYFS